MEAEYVNHMGSDLTVVDAARVSFNKQSKWSDTDEFNFPIEKEEQYLSSKDKKLIEYLASHGHWTPFSHPQITMRYTVPIFVARQEFKHIVGFTRNEVSRRYVDDTPEFYMPEVWRSRPEGSVKQGSGSGEIIDVVWGSNDGLVSNTYEIYNNVIDWTQGAYHDLLAAGVAPEQARMVLPQSMYTSYYITGSLAAFARMVKQRTDPHAQIEIQELARMVDEVIRPLYPVSWEAFMDN
jgi:thymidylate synthase (FAD)